MYAELSKSGLLSASMTTPDTLLPPTETILRDFLSGQEWLHANGIELMPSLSYFPDNFGHSPALPSLMRSLGISNIGITRIDGMYFVASDYRSKSQFPLKGSTAEQLQRAHRTLDFVWRNDDGAEVLCHWNAFTYFQGDMLATAGIIRWMGKTFGVSWRSRRHVTGRIKRYVCDLSRADALHVLSDRLRLQRTDRRSWRAHRSLQRRGVSRDRGLRDPGRPG